MGTLRAAVSWTNYSSNDNKDNLSNPAPNTVVFDTSGVFATPQTITLTMGTMVLSDTNPAGMAIDGPGQALTISGANQVEVFQVNSGVTATLTDLTISGGSSTSEEVS